MTGKKTHELKCCPSYFTDIIEGRKCFEWRKDDRGYGEGDALHLREWDEDAGMYTGRTADVVVTYILRGGFGFGVPDGYCVMSIEHGHGSVTDRCEWCGRDEDGNL